MRKKYVINGFTVMNILAVGFALGVAFTIWVYNSHIEELRFERYEDRVCTLELSDDGDWRNIDIDNSDPLRVIIMDGR